MSFALANVLRAWGAKVKPWQIDPYGRTDRAASLAEWREWREQAAAHLPDTLPEADIKAHMEELFNG